MVLSLVYSSFGLLVLTMGFKLPVFNRTRNFQWVMQLAHGHSAYARLILSFWFEVQGLQYLINDKHIQLPEFSLGFSPIMFWLMGGNPKHWVFGSAWKDDNLRFCCWLSRHLWHCLPSKVHAIEWIFYFLGASGIAKRFLHLHPQKWSSAGPQEPWIHGPEE